MTVTERKSQSHTANGAEEAEEARMAYLKVRFNEGDAYYGGSVVDGARVLRLFGDLVTEITVRMDGDEGLLSEYTDIRFTAPVHPGDFIEARGRLVRTSRLKRVMELTAYRVICATTELRSSGATVLDPPVLVCKATATTVIPASVAKKESS